MRQFPCAWSNVALCCLAQALMVDSSGITRSGIDRLIFKVTALEFLLLSANVSLAPIISSKDSSSIEVVRIAWFLYYRAPMLVV